MVSLPKQLIAVISSYLSVKDKKELLCVRQLAYPYRYNYMIDDAQYSNGLLHSVGDHPTMQAVSDLSETYYAMWYLDGLLNRKNNPAVIRGSTKEWFKDGQLHHLDGPAYVNEEDDIEYWFNYGLLHRTDGPAKKCLDGQLEWYHYGILHREDGPAIVCADGTKKWYYRGNLHRVDGPAIDYISGTKEWYKNGKRHCEDGPAVITNTRLEWYKDGLLHRKNGPAVIYLYNNEEIWYLNGLIHREDGPAATYRNGTKLWYKHGYRIENYSTPYNSYR